MEVKEFIDLLRRNVPEETLEDHHRAILNIVPKKGCLFTLSCDLVDLIRDGNYIYLSNDTEGVSAINLLLSNDESWYKDKNIAFEVYGLDESETDTNSQIIIVTDIVSEDICIKTEDNNIIIDLSIPYICSGQYIR